MIGGAEIEAAGDWPALVNALAAAHRGPRAQLDDLLLRAGEDAWLNRAAWIEGDALGLKSVTIFPGNTARTPPLPSINGVMMVFDGQTGEIEAALDGAALTVWKTVADSALGVRQLARDEAEDLLIVGAGTIARRAPEAFLAVRPGLKRIRLWNRTRERAEEAVAALRERGIAGEVAGDLEAAVRAADIISCATMSTEPVIRGDWLKAGAHLDLIGAYRPDMREADDTALTRGRLFVDRRDTTIGEIGELIIPMESGMISQGDVLADHYDLARGAAGRAGPDDITIFKNGGGAHLDLMTARFFMNRLAESGDG